MRSFHLVIVVDSLERMLGSFAPKAEAYEYAFPVDTTPSGMLSRGSYVAVARVFDDDKTMFLQTNYKMKISKSW